MADWQPYDAFWPVGVARHAGDVGNWLGGSSAPGADYATGILNNKGQAQVGPNPYQGNWSALIQALTQKANGQGPSEAGMAYQRASDTGFAQQAGIAGGSGSSAMALQAARNAGQQQMGYANGYGQARAAEMTGAQGALIQALQGGGQSDFQRQQANQEAYMRALQILMGGKTNADEYGKMFLGAAQKAAQGGAQMAGG